MLIIKYDMLKKIKLFIYMYYIIINPLLEAS